MSAKPIDPFELGPKELKQALDQLPESMRSKISGVAKTPEILREDQSPEAIRKANLVVLKAKRRDIITSLVEIEKEIQLTEDLTYAEAFSPEIRREHILAALNGTERQLGRRSFLLSEMRALYPHPGITFASWITELTSLHQQGCIFYAEDRIIVLRSRRDK